MATPLFPVGAPDVLYLVDLSGYIFRAYHAIAPLTSPTGEPTQAVYGTVNMLEKLVRERQPKLLAVAMDSTTPTFRKQLYDAYKATRPPPPEDLKSQMRRVGQIVRAFPLPCFQRDGFEADDLIASAVRQARQRGLKVVIVSADKDLMQLVGEDVVLWDTMRDKVIGVEEVEARFGVPIPQVRDVLALMGDSSDNVPGVPSVGPKTAQELISKYGTLSGVYEHLDELKRKKLRETLLEHKDNAFLSQRLVTLRDDVDVNFEPDVLRFERRNPAELRQLYAELGFQRHLAALEESAGGQPSTVSAAVQQLATVECLTDATDLDALLPVLKQKERLAVFALVMGDAPMTQRWVGLGLCVEPGKSYYVPLEHRYVGAPAQLPLERVVSFLTHALALEVQWGAHDAKQLMITAQRHGLPLERCHFDSLLASYLLDSTSGHDLEYVVQSELGLALTPYEQLTRKRGRQQLACDEVPVEDAAAFAGNRAEALMALWDPLQQRLEEETLSRVCSELELPLASLLTQMEQTGVCLDCDALNALSETLTEQLKALETRAHAVAGTAFNVNSPRQLEKLLFDQLGLKPLRRTKTSRSTDAETLEALSTQHELPRIILEIRQLSKLQGTYVNALPQLVDPNTGRVHTQWHQDVAATGRLSSSAPNLQNIPIRSELGRRIREAFVAPKGYLLVSADYSQIELRVLAHLSKDPVLIDAFRTGQDIHQRTAMEIFELDADEVNAEYRRRAKAVNFGVIYGQGDSALAKSLGISRHEAGQFIAAYFRRYAGVARFMEETLSTARASGSVRTLFGRRRIVSDLNSANRAKRLAAERIVMNTPIQGTAADLLKMAMLALSEPVTPSTRMLLTVHDELVFEVAQAEAEAAKARIREKMQNVFPLEVPLVVDVGAGPNWSAAH